MRTTLLVVAALVLAAQSAAIGVLHERANRPAQEQPQPAIAAQAGDRGWLEESVAGADVVVPKRIGSRPLRLLWEQFLQDHPDV